MPELIIANYFFIIGLTFILGNIFFHISKLWFLFNFLLGSLFYFKFRNIRILILVVVIAFLGSFYSFLRLTISLPIIKIPDFIQNYRIFINNKAKTFLPFPLENIFRGILMGEKFETRELYESFVNSGLIHLTAVSGQNLTIMFSIFYEALKYFKFLTPNLIFVLSLFVIIFFILFMGFEGNVLRAGIMGFLLVLIKSKFGRLPLKRNILIFVLLLFVIVEPSSLVKNVGTQLSFLAIGGIFYLAPIIEKELEFLKMKFLRKTLAETLSSQIFTYPLIIYNFGNFNFFSLVSNLLALPFIPYFMFLASLFLFLPIKYVSWLSLPFLVYIFYLAKIFSNFVIYFKIPLILTISLYFFIFLEIYYYLKNETIDFRLDIN